MDERWNQLLCFINNEKNMAKEFLDEMHNNDKKIYLYGGGASGQWYLDFLHKYHLTPECIIDNRVSKLFHYSDDEDKTVECIPYSKAKKQMDTEKGIVLISALKYRNEIKTELLKKFPEEAIFCFEIEMLIHGFVGDIQKYRRYLTTNWDSIMKSVSQYADVYSKVTFEAVIKGRITGNVEYYDLVREENAYLPKDLFEFEDNEVICDCGAFDGDSAACFSEAIGEKQNCKMYCFEVDSDILPSLKNTVESIQNMDVQIVEAGVSDRRKTVQLIQNGDGTSSLVDGNTEDNGIKVVALDEYVKDNVTFIKMDIEGSELAALHGAEKIIKQDKPKLAICVYHKYGDFAEIQEYLSNIVPEYKFYLRHHNYAGPDTVLYALI